MARLCCFLLLLLLTQLIVVLVTGDRRSFLRLPSEQDVVGTRWAVLIAGSNGYYNYRHQADVCHAYQILKNGGLRDDNIIVFMYDDIADNPENPRPGVIINHPDGGDVYAGVPKDYTGKDVNANNFLAALLGDKSKLTGGSGKVVSSGPDDHIFVYYADHGGPGVLGMPSDEEYLYANDLVQTLVKKHAAGAGYKSLVFYLEACESGSMFEGLLPGDIGVYATTAANAEESSWGTYCPGDEQGAPPPEYDTCLGDLYSVSWMEDSDDAHDRRDDDESLKQQYDRVRDRTSAHGTYSLGSHVMQYGDLDLNAQNLHLYMGSGTHPNDDTQATLAGAGGNSLVNQRDADLLYFWNKYRRSGDGEGSRSEARRQLVEMMARRSRLDSSVELIGGLLFGSDQGPKVLSAVRPAGQPLADDWDCLKSMVRRFEERCGTLGQYGMKHMRSLANICNAGVGEEAMAKVAAQACANIASQLFLN